MGDEALDFLMGGGIPPVRFAAKGAKVSGIVTAMEKQQQRNLDTGEPMCWEDGNPKWQIVITLQTSERDPEIPGDNGLRKLYAKGQMQAAIRDAVRASGHIGTLVRGVLVVQYYADGEASKRGFNPPKQYRARFEPPAPVEFDREPGDESEEQPPPPERW